MSIDATKLRRAMKYIKEHPEGWDQGNWACETKGCLAGTIVMLEKGLTWKQLQTEMEEAEERLEMEVMDTWAKEILGDDKGIMDHAFFIMDEGLTYETFEKRVTEITGITFGDDE